MPKSELHAAKRRKNLTVLAILLGIVGGLFYLTLLKMRGA